MTNSEKYSDTIGLNESLLSHSVERLEAAAKLPHHPEWKQNIQDALVLVKVLNTLEQEIELQKIKPEKQKKWWNK